MLTLNSVVPDIQGNAIT